MHCYLINVFLKQDIYTGQYTNVKWNPTKGRSQEYWVSDLKEEFQYEVNSMRPTAEYLFFKFQSCASSLSIDW